MSKVNLLLDFVLNTAASLKGTGIHLIRIAIFIIFVWLVGWSFGTMRQRVLCHSWQTVRLWASSTQRKHQSIRTNKLKRTDEFDKVKHDSAWSQQHLHLLSWFRYCHYVIWHFDLIRYLVSKDWFRWFSLVILMTFGTLSFLCHDSRSMGTRLRKWRARVPVTYWCGSSGYQGCMYSGRSGRCLGRLCTTNP